MFIKKNHLSGDERAWVSYHDASTVEKTVGDGGKFGLISNMPARFRNFAIITATNIEVFYFIYFFFFFFFFCFLVLFIFSIFSSGCIFPFAQLRKELLQGYLLFLELNQGRFYFFFYFFFFFSSPSHIPPPPPKGQQRPGQMWRTRPRPSSISWRPRLYLPRPHLHHHPCDSFGLPSGISSHHRESGDCF